MKWLCCCCVTRYCTKKNGTFWWIVFHSKDERNNNVVWGGTDTWSFHYWICDKVIFSLESTAERMEAARAGSASVGATNQVSVVIYKSQRRCLFIMRQYWSLEVQKEALFSRLFLHCKVMQYSRVELWIQMVLRIHGLTHGQLEHGRDAAGASSGLVLLGSVNNQHCLSETALGCEPKGLEGGWLRGWQFWWERKRTQGCTKAEASKGWELKLSTALQTLHPNLQMKDGETFLTYYFPDFSCAFGVQLRARTNRHHGHGHQNPRVCTEHHR